MNDRNLAPWFLIGGLILAFVVSLSLVVSLLNPPLIDVIWLFVFMLTSGLTTIAAAYGFYRWRLIQRFKSLRWALVTTITLTVILTFANVWYTAQLMFISEHDLILTTALLFFAGIVSVVSMFFIASAMIMQIREVSSAAERLARGDLNSRIVVQGNDELAQLGQTFNMMAEALQAVDRQKQQLEQTRRDLIAWVSHDLRTPLAAIRAMNEAIIDGVVADPQTIAEYTYNIQRETQHLTRLIDDLFELSKLDTGHFRLTCEPTSLHDLISDTIGSLMAQAERDQITLSGQVSEQVGLVNLAADKIQRVLYNLLDNALKYTPKGGSITITAQREGSHVYVKVHNTGSAIAPEDTSRLFESFYRGEASRASSPTGDRGTGLGLAIARGFVVAHGGEIGVESTPMRGTTFWFTLP
ncbi:MAG: HAMP domain-containing histidine kinase [Anaerolineae bacterium]|jgi:two-component system sensor histidine kinase SaeS|nr:HAMP domain-containing histidine kinase [Anaerolineae bacterium]